MIITQEILNKILAEVQTFKQKVLGILVKENIEKFRIAADFSHHHERLSMQSELYKGWASLNVWIACEIDEVVRRCFSEEELNINDLIWNNDTVKRLTDEDIKLLNTELHKAFFKEINEIIERNDLPLISENSSELKYLHVYGNKIFICGNLYEYNSMLKLLNLKVALSRLYNTEITEIKDIFVDVMADTTSVTTTDETENNQNKDWLRELLQEKVFNIIKDIYPEFLDRSFSDTEYREVVEVINEFLRKINSTIVGLKLPFVHDLRFIGIFDKQADRKFLCIKGGNLIKTAIQQYDEKNTVFYNIGYEYGPDGCGRTIIITEKNKFQYPVQLILGSKRRIVTISDLVDNVLINETERIRQFTVRFNFLECADLTGIKLGTDEKDNQGDFEGAKLSGVCFKNADLRNLNFTNTDLVSADLSGANCENCDFTEACLSDVIIDEHTNLAGVKLGLGCSYLWGLKASKDSTILSKAFVKRYIECNQNKQIICFEYNDGNLGVDWERTEKNWKKMSSKDSEVSQKYSTIAAVSLTCSLLSVIGMFIYNRLAMVKLDSKILLISAIIGFVFGIVLSKLFEWCQVYKFKTSPEDKVIDRISKSFKLTFCCNGIDPILHT